MLPGGVYFDTFSSRFTSTRSINTASNLTRGKSRGSCTTTVCRCSMPRAASSAAPTTSSSGCHCKFSLTSPLSMRAMSSRLLTMRAHAVRLILDRLRGFQLRARQFGRRERQGFRQSHQHGQGRAQIVRQRRQQRIAQPLGFHLEQRILRNADVVHTFQGNRNQRGKSVEQLPLLRECAACAGCAPSPPTRRAPSSARAAECTAPRSPARCRCRNLPADPDRRPTGRCRFQPPAPRHSTWSRSVCRRHPAAAAQRSPEMCAEWIHR